MRFSPLVKTEGRVSLDMKDKRILSLLAADARLPATAIAKRVGLSRDAVSYRIKLYEEKGLIQGYKTLVDIQHFGFENYHLFLQFHKPSLEEEQKLLATLAAFPFTRAVLKFSGKYDLELAMIASSLSMFEKQLKEVLHACRPYLLDYKTLIITKQYRSGSFPTSFFHDMQEPAVSKKKMILYNLDAKDKVLLHILADHARLPLAQMTQATKLSADAVRYRLQKLLQSGHIVKFIPAINYALLGYQVYAILMQITSLTDQEEMILKRFFSTDQHILWAVKTLGEYNLLFYIAALQPTDVHATLQRLRSLFSRSISTYDTLIAEEEYKYTYLPDILFQNKNV